VLRAQAHQAGEAAHARHCEIEQDEIEFAVAPEQLADFFEATGFRDLDVLEPSRHGLAQGTAEQRMIVGDNQTKG
jgi:hypothetical protein